MPFPILCSPGKKWRSKLTTIESSSSGSNFTERHSSKLPKSLIVPWMKPATTRPEESITNSMKSSKIRLGLSLFLRVTSLWTRTSWTYFSSLRRQVHRGVYATSSCPKCKSCWCRDLRLLARYSSWDSLIVYAWNLASYSQSSAIVLRLFRSSRGQGLSPQ